MPKKKKTNTAFLKMAQAPLKPSPQLAEVLGSAAPHIPATGREKGVGILSPTNNDRTCPNLVQFPCG
jgi:hypothetical protein